MIIQRNRYIFFALISLLFLVFTGYYFRQYPINSITEHLPTTSKEEPYPKYKPESKFPSPPIIDNFPLAASAHTSSQLPTIPSWNTPPSPHVPESTPLFIGFTRNWRLLQQVVVSYITSGWPPEDIYVIENTGVMDSNAKGKLSLQNPFFVNHTRLKMLGVNIIRTPTLLSFAQLQNFYLHTSIEKGWPVYFWSHMDIIALSFEGKYAEKHPDSLTPTSDHSNFNSLYKNCLHHLRLTNSLTGAEARWAMRFFNYDRLALVNVAAFVDVGGWDTMIGYYMTDCDMHSRISMAGWGIKDVPAGILADVASSLDDLIVLYRKNNTGVTAGFVDPNKIEEEIQALEEAEKEKKKAGKKDKKNERAKRDIDTKKEDEEASEGATKFLEDDIYSKNYNHLVDTLNAMEVSKGQSKKGRNTWQTRQRGGEGEPFYRDAKGFDDAVQMTIEHGRNIYAEKWGHRGCDIREKGLVPGDAWRVEHDW